MVGRATRWRPGARTPRRCVDLNAALEADLAPHGLTLGDYQVLVLPLGGRRPRDADVRPRGARCSSPPAASPAASTGSSRMGVVERRPSDARPPRDARRPHRRTAGVPRAGRPDHVESVRRHIIDLISTPTTGGDGPRLRARSSAALDADRCSSTVTSQLPAGFSCHVANIGVKDDTDDFVVRRRRPTRARGRRVHAQPLRRPERARSAAHTSPTARRGRSSSCRRTPTSPTGPTATPTPSELVDGVADAPRLRRRRRARRVDRRDRPALPDGPHPRRRRRDARAADRHRRRRPPRAGS